ncbi:acetyl-CoA carboxylase biotin carboxyl carrier protein subunit [soil metagenome]
MAEVSAEIDAEVGRVPAEVGRAVAVGDELVILKSMNTEIPVLAPIAGEVAEVRVASGAHVQAGEVLAVIGE